MWRSKWNFQPELHEKFEVSFFGFRATKLASLVPGYSGYNKVPGWLFNNNVWWLKILRKKYLLFCVSKVSISVGGPIVGYLQPTVAGLLSFLGIHLAKQQNVFDQGFNYILSKLLSMESNNKNTESTNFELCAKRLLQKKVRESEIDRCAYLKVECMTIS